MYPLWFLSDDLVSHRCRRVQWLEWATRALWLQRNPFFGNHSLYTVRWICSVDRLTIWALWLPKNPFLPAIVHFTDFGGLALLIAPHCDYIIMFRHGTSMMSLVSVTCDNFVIQKINDQCQRRWHMEAILEWHKLIFFWREIQWPVQFCILHVAWNEHLHRPWLTTVCYTVMYPVICILSTTLILIASHLTQSWSHFFQVQNEYSYKEEIITINRSSKDLLHKKKPCHNACTTLRQQHFPRNFVINGCCGKAELLLYLIQKWAHSSFISWTNLPWQLYKHWSQMPVEGESHCILLMMSLTFSWIKTIWWMYVLVPTGIPVISNNQTDNM